MTNLALHLHCKDTCKSTVCITWASSFSTWRKVCVIVKCVVRTTEVPLITRYMEVYRGESCNHAGMDGTRLKFQSWKAINFFCCCFLSKISESWNPAAAWKFPPTIDSGSKADRRHSVHSRQQSTCLQFSSFHFNNDTKQPNAFVHHRSQVKR